MIASCNVNEFWTGSDNYQLSSAIYSKLFNKTDASPTLNRDSTYDILNNYASNVEKSTGFEVGPSIDFNGLYDTTGDPLQLTQEQIDSSHIFFTDNHKYKYLNLGILKIEYLHLIAQIIISHLV